MSFCCHIFRWIFAFCHGQRCLPRTNRRIILYRYNTIYRPWWTCPETKDFLQRSKICFSIKSAAYSIRSLYSTHLWHEREQIVTCSMNFNHTAYWAMKILFTRLRCYLTLCMDVCNTKPYQECRKLCCIIVVLKQKYELLQFKINRNSFSVNFDVCLEQSFNVVSYLFSKQIASSQPFHWDNLCHHWNGRHRRPEKWIHYAQYTGAT